MTSQAPITEAYETITARWLRRHIRREIGFKLMEGFVLFGAGVIVTALLAALLAAPVLLALAPDSEGRNTSTIVWVGAGCFAAVLLGSWLVAKLRAEPDHTTVRTARGVPVIIPNRARVTAVTSDFLAGGTRLLLAGYESFSAAGRLWRSDLAAIAPVIVWMWVRKSKASGAEIAAQFPAFNTVRNLPPLRDIPGIIWLPDPRGVLILTSEFRERLSGLLPSRWSYAEETKPPEPEPPPPWPGEASADAEIVRCYEILGLPAYAPIQQVKRRYRQLAKLHHPDAAAGRAGVRSDEKMKQLNAAYDAIMERHEQSGRP